MALTLEDLIKGIQGSREHFWKHLEGLREDQWDWKPYTECKSIRETLLHLLVDDRAAIESIESGKEPEYDALSDKVFAESPREEVTLRALLTESHAQVCRLIQTRFADAPMDSDICIYGTNMKLGAGVPYLSSEDFYHAGQVAFIRQATDPTWDYYKAVYGFGE